MVRDMLSPVVKPSIETFMKLLLYRVYSNKNLTSCCLRFQHVQYILASFKQHTDQCPINVSQSAPLSLSTPSLLQAPAFIWTSS